MSGRRLRHSVQEVFGDEAKYVVIAGYSNVYGGYVATHEEYEMQHYEGGHTLFGPWTLAGYQQEYVRLARAMINAEPVRQKADPARDWLDVKRRSIQLGNGRQTKKCQLWRRRRSAQAGLREGRASGGRVLDRKSRETISTPAETISPSNFRKATAGRPSRPMQTGIHAAAGSLTARPRSLARSASPGIFPRTRRAGRIESSTTVVFALKPTAKGSRSMPFPIRFALGKLLHLLCEVATRCQEFIILMVDTYA